MATEARPADSSGGLIQVHGRSQRTCGPYTGAAPRVVPTLLQSSAPGWPLVVYFHHVDRSIDHYTSLAPDSFARGLDLLLGAFAPVAFDELVAPDGTLCRPEGPTVLVTFDDGYAGLTNDAIPILEMFGIRATFFVCTDLIGRSSPDPRADYLSWSDVDALAAAGHTVGSHGRTHRALTELSAAEASCEVTTSIRALRARNVIRHCVYAYPYGKVAPVPDHVPGVGRLTAFGTVKSRAVDWTAAPTAIRRVYLPTGEEASWPALVRQWRRNWEVEG